MELATLWLVSVFLTVCGMYQIISVRKEEEKNLDEFWKLQREHGRAVTSLYDSMTRDQQKMEKLILRVNASVKELQRLSDEAAMLKSSAAPSPIHMSAEEYAKYVKEFREEEDEFEYSGPHDYPQGYPGQVFPVTPAQHRAAKRSKHASHYAHLNDLFQQIFKKDEDEEDEK